MTSVSYQAMPDRHAHAALESYLNVPEPEEVRGGLTPEDVTNETREWLKTH